jgi:hypothetical protein
MGNCASKSKQEDENPESPPVKKVKISPQATLIPPSQTSWNSQPDSLSPAAQETLTRYLKQNHDIIFANNREWILAKKAMDPLFFTKLSTPQHPEYL